MKLMPRLVTLFKSKAHDTLTYLEDPASNARQLVRDLTIQIGKTEEILAEIMGEEKVLTKKSELAEEEKNSWFSRAEKAVKGEREDLARSALDKAYQSEQMLIVYQKTISHLTPKILKIKNKLEELRKLKTKMEQEVSLLDIRAKTASISAKAVRILKNVGDNPINFEALNQHVSSMEGKAEALEELSEHQLEEVLENDFYNMNTNTYVEEKLTELRNLVQKG